MDSVKLGIFLLVIVGVTALGSGNEASKEYTKPTPEPKRLTEPEEDDTSSPKRSIGAGTVIKVAEFGISILTKILTLLGDIKRKIAIGVENNSEHDWKGLNVFFYSGASDVPLPKKVETGKVILYDARKTTGPVARGCVGVMAYYIPTLNKTLHVMFSVPYDYNLYSNWWNVALFDGKAEADESKYNGMYNGKPFKGDNAWYEKDIGSGLKVEGSMANSGTATLQIRVNKAE